MKWILSICVASVQFLRNYSSKRWCDWSISMHAIVLVGVTSWTVCVSGSSLVQLVLSTLKAPILMHKWRRLARTLALFSVITRVFKASVIFAWHLLLAEHLVVYTFVKFTWPSNSVIFKNNQYFISIFYFILLANRTVLFVFILSMLGQAAMWFQFPVQSSVSIIRKCKKFSDEIRGWCCKSMWVIVLLMTFIQLHFRDLINSLQIAASYFWRHRAVWIL